MTENKEKTAQEKALDNFSDKMLETSLNAINDAYQRGKSCKLSEFSTKELVDELCGYRNIDEVKKLLDERKIGIVLEY